MADGVGYTPGSGVTIASDETTDASLGAGNFQFQYVKLADGTPNSVTKSTIKAASTNPQTTDTALVVAPAPLTRNIVNAATVIGGVATVTTEALVALAVSRDGATTSSVTSIGVTSGKRYRITAIVLSLRQSSAAVVSARVALRMNPSGAVTTSSPIVALAAIPAAAATAELGNTVVIPIPDGIELTGAMQVGLSAVASATTGFLFASLQGYEY